MDILKFCREIPKVELHAHLNGSLSRATMTQLKRYYADSGLKDQTNAFFDEFEVGAGDSRNLSDCFQVFSIAHSLTTTPIALNMATTLTLEEFEKDGCCYIELRSTPKDTEYMTKKQYLETIVQAITESTIRLNIISRFIVSINRSSSTDEAEEIADLAIDVYKRHPKVVVGIELSGNPNIGNFKDFVPALVKARNAGLKVTLHCAEVCNPSEILEMLEFKPERIGHGIYIHPRFGGTEDTWNTLCKSNTPVEVCLTSNVNTKSVLSYDHHHFKELYETNIPVILCTDDKGVFMTSLSQEYLRCAETFNLSQSQLSDIALNATRYIFADEVSKLLESKVRKFIQDNVI